MLVKRFNQVFTETMKTCAGILVRKEGEYAVKADRLIQFNHLAEFRGQKPRQILGGMMLKHTDAVYNLIDRPECASLDAWDEKIIDHINYLILLRAVVIEELGDPKC